MTENIPKVAIIITSYNRPTKVIRAIESVLAQSFQDFHLYIMDNNSMDSLKTRLKNKYGDNAKITLYFTDTKDEDRIKCWWLSVLINIAMKIGKEDLISVMTDDEWYEPKRLEYMVKFLDDHPEVEICYCSQECKFENGDILTRRMTGNEPMITGACNIDHNQIMWRRTLSEKVGEWLITLNNMPDSDFLARVSHFCKLFPIDYKEVLEHNDNVDFNKKLTHLLASEEGRKYLTTGGLME